MGLIFLVLPALVVLLLFLREVHLYREHERLNMRLREDDQVRELEAIFDLDWQWP